MKKNVLLFNPPLYFDNGQPRALDVSVPPLGLLYLASYINSEKFRFKAKVVDVAVEGISLKEIKSLVKKERPMAIGITSMTPQLQGTIELAGFLRKNFPLIKIFLGGPHISADPNFMNRFAGLFDYAITGEAEITFSRSLEKLAGEKKIPKIQTGEIVTDLDDLPFPDKKLIKRERYSQYESMIFGRGCPYQCYYCSRPSISRKVRYRSPSNLILEIKKVIPYCQGKIDFQDDTFTLDRDKVIEFCRLVRKEKLGLNWRCNTRIDLVDQELLSQMSQSGCRLIHFGIEAGNEKIRQDVVCKGRFSNADITKVIGWCHQAGIKFAGYFIIGHPGEGKKELEQTKKMILNSGIDLVGLSIPTPFPGSKLYEIAKERGIINEKIIDQFAQKKLGEGYVGIYPLYVSEKISQEELFSLMKYINRHFYINWRTFWKRLKEDICSASKLKSDFFELVSLIAKGISTHKPYEEKND